MKDTPKDKTKQSTLIPINVRLTPQKYYEAQCMAASVGIPRKAKGMRPTM